MKNIVHNLIRDKFSCSAPQLYTQVTIDASVNSFQGF